MADAMPETPQAHPPTLAMDASVFAPSRAEVRVPGGFVTWLVMGVVGHVGLFFWAWLLVVASEVLSMVNAMRASQRDFFEATYEVELDEPKKEAEKPKEPEPPPEPDPEPVAIQVPTPSPKGPDPYEEPAPAAAQAAKVLTSDDDPVDLTGEGFVSGTATAGSFYGQVAASGTGTSPTYNPNARVGGSPTGTGTGTGPARPPPAPTGPDRSRAPTVIGGSWNSCGFPPEADANQIDEAVATIVVTVRPDGSPLSVRVVSDPGNGFGRQARVCALAKRYAPGLDREGNPTTATTPPIAVRFTR